jgi:hypothetical protein
MNIGYFICCLVFNSLYSTSATDRVSVRIEEVGLQSTQRFESYFKNGHLKRIIIISTTTHFLSPEYCSFPSSRAINEDKRAGHVQLMGEVRNAYKIMIGEPEETRSLAESRHS